MNSMTMKGYSTGNDLLGDRAIHDDRLKGFREMAYSVRKGNYGYKTTRQMEGTFQLIPRI